MNFEEIWGTDFLWLKDFVNLVSDDRLQFKPQPGHKHLFICVFNECEMWHFQTLLEHVHDQHWGSAPLQLRGKSQMWATRQIIKNGHIV